MIVHATLHSARSKAKRQGWLRAIRSEADELAMMAGCVFSPRLADYACNFFPRFLCHSKGQWAGKPFELLEWQRSDIIRPLFGWVRPDGTRRFRRCYIEIPKKNGKSALASGIGLYMLLGDGERGAEVYSAASDRDQASIVHREAINMVYASPALESLLKVNASTHLISCPKTNSVYKAISATPSGKEGFNAHCIICDELHVWRGRELWDALLYAGRARTQPLLFVITTAGADSLSVCREQHDYAANVLNGTFRDDRFFAYIREATKEEIDAQGAEDRALWYKANPSMGVTINPEEFGRDLAEAARTPTAWASFLRYSFNVWNTGAKRWLSVDQWRRCEAQDAAAAIA
jgi:phage terminase large subunit-like protein